MEILLYVFCFLWDFGNFGCIDVFSKIHVTADRLLLYAVNIPLLNFGQTESVIDINTASYVLLLCYNTLNETCRSCTACIKSLNVWSQILTLYTTSFNITQIHVLPTQCIYVFYVLMWERTAIISQHSINWLIL